LRVEVAARDGSAGGDVRRETCHNIHIRRVTKRQSERVREYGGRLGRPHGRRRGLETE
jgi:hypothetical protein